MTTAQIRVLTSDLPVYDRAIATGDGATLEFQTSAFPLLTDTVRVYLDGVLQTETSDYELDLEVGLVTFLVAPDAAAAIVMTYRHALLSDQNLADLSDLYTNVRRASAAALDTMASSEAIVQKKIRLLDLTTDGPAVAKALRDHAALLREQADVEEQALDGGFDIAEQVFDRFGLRERLLDQVLRGAI